MVATVTAGYFLLTADYGSEPNALDPVKRAIQSAESSVKDFIFGKHSHSLHTKNETQTKVSVFFSPPFLFQFNALSSLLLYI